jgi:hypothetical protein
MIMHQLFGNKSVVNRRWIAIAIAMAVTVMFQAVPGAQAQAGKVNCSTLLSSKEVATVLGTTGIQDPEQLSGDDPTSPLAKGVIVCVYATPKLIVKFSVYTGPSVQSPFGTVWKDKKGTPLAGIGEGAYFDEKGLNTGVARVKGKGLTLQLISGFMTKSPPTATTQSWTEQILKIVAGRL